MFSQTTYMEQDSTNNHLVLVKKLCYSWHKYKGSIKNIKKRQKTIYLSRIDKAN